MQVMMLSVGIAFACALFFYILKVNFNKFMTGPNVEPGLIAEVNHWKAKAPLVVVGVVLDLSEEINDKVDRNTASVMSYLIMNLAVESVERGHYNDETIKVYFGWYSAEPEEETLPKDLKQEYHKGDRVRIYLDYDPDRYGYYTPWSYYTIEPAG